MPGDIRPGDNTAVSAPGLWIPFRINPAQPTSA